MTRKPPDNSYGRSPTGKGTGLQNPLIQVRILSAVLMEDYTLETALRYNSQAWGMDDVASIALAIDNSHEKDEPDYTWILEMKSGEWFAARGWHDYTGWDCQSGLTTEKYKTKEEAFATLVDWERDIVEKNAVVAQR